MLYPEETIVAQATPPGRGGISIVRLSGSRVSPMMQQILGHLLKPRHAAYLSFLGTEGDSIDQGIAIFFPAPHSFTGEDVLELHCHGGPVVVDLLLERMLSLGARLAEPGEFSKRAFLNGKCDLTKAEAIADLIAASSRQAARSALRVMQGEFAAAIHALVESIVQLRMWVEASIDFTEEEIDFLSKEKIGTHLLKAMDDLTLLASRARQGNLLREGMTLVISGKPNVGKSSLMNCLSGKSVAIVTEMPGTTRDLLHTDIILDGMPLHVIDTAGLRASQDVIEQEGIRRAKAEIMQADLILYMVDATLPHESFLQEAVETLPQKELLEKMILLRNKIDLSEEQSSITDLEGITCISLSAKTQMGIELLRETIKQKAGFHAEMDDSFIARRRHLNALDAANTHLQAALKQLHSDFAAELLAEDLRQAQRVLSEITGEFSTDDLLGRIFTNFCIGK